MAVSALQGRNEMRCQSLILVIFHRVAAEAAGPSAKAAALGPLADGSKPTIVTEAQLQEAGHPGRDPPLQPCPTVTEREVAMQGARALGGHPHSNQEQRALALLPHTTGELAAENALRPRCQHGQVPPAMADTRLQYLPRGGLLAVEPADVMLRETWGHGAMGILAAGLTQ